MQAELESFFEQLVFGPPTDPTNTADMSRLLNSLHLPDDQREELRAQVAHAAIYRELIHSGLRDAIEIAMPRTVARLGPVFDEHFLKFLRERGPRTHYLRDVATEFLHFCEPLWAGDGRVPPWATDLARHESLQIEVASAVHAPRSVREEALELELPVRFTASCRLMHYRYAVHRLVAAIEDRTEPTLTQIALFVYRSLEHDVRYLELSPLAAAILQKLLPGRQTLRSALAEACSEHGVSLDELQLRGTAELLADLAERGALLGHKAEQPDASSLASSE